MSWVSVTLNPFVGRPAQSTVTLFFIIKCKKVNVFLAINTIGWILSLKVLPRSYLN